VEVAMKVSYIDKDINLYLWWMRFRDSGLSVDIKKIDCHRKLRFIFERSDNGLEFQSEALKQMTDLNYLRDVKKSYINTELSLEAAFRLNELVDQAA